MTPVKKHRSSSRGRASNSSSGVRTALPVPLLFTSERLSTLDGPCGPAPKPSEVETRAPSADCRLRDGLRPLADDGLAAPSSLARSRAAVGLPSALLGAIFVEKIKCIVRLNGEGPRRFRKAVFVRCPTFFPLLSGPSKGSRSKWATKDGRLYFWWH